jgi:hypothetical protein
MKQTIVVYEDGIKIKNIQRTLSCHSDGRHQISKIRYQGMDYVANYSIANNLYYINTEKDE